MVGDDPDSKMQTGTETDTALRPPSHSQRDNPVVPKSEEETTSHGKL
jgi:hypothetical protein